MSNVDSKPQEELDLNFHTDMPVGEILRRTRVHYGQSLFQVEQVLRIRASQLDALEKGDVSKLPGRVYAIGFVRSYSEYLGLDGDKMVFLFKEQSVGRQKKTELSFPVPASESKVPNLAILGGSLFGAAVLIGFISYMFFPERPAQEIPQVPEALTKSQLNEAPSLVATQQPSPMAKAQQDILKRQQDVPQDDNAAAEATDAQGADTSVKRTNRIVLEITEASWIEIKDSTGRALIRQVLKPGDVYLVPDQPGLVMATGNAGGVKVKVDGKDTKPLGAPSQVRRKIPLDPAFLLQGSP